MVMRKLFEVDIESPVPFQNVPRRRPLLPPRADGGPLLTRSNLVILVSWVPCFSKKKSVNCSFSFILSSCHLTPIRHFNIDPFLERDWSRCIRTCLSCSFCSNVEARRGQVSMLVFLLMAHFHSLISFNIVCFKINVGFNLGTSRSKVLLSNKWFVRN